MCGLPDLNRRGSVSSQIQLCERPDAPLPLTHWPLHVPSSQSTGAQGTLKVQI